jgi:hypothetical protein
MEKRRYSYNEKDYILHSISVMSNRGGNKITLADIKTITENINSKFPAPEDSSPRTERAVHAAVKRMVESLSTPETRISVVCWPKKEKRKIPLIPNSAKGLVSLLKDLESNLKIATGQVKGLCETVKVIAEENIELKQELRNLCEIRKAVEKYQSK